MRIWKTAAAVGAAVALTALTGCLTVDPRASALAKIGAGNMTALTSDELQAFVETADAFVGQVDVDFSADDAEAVVEFIQENNLDTVQDIRTLVENPQNVVFPEAFTTFLESVGVDVPEGGLG